MSQPTVSTEQTWSLLCTTGKVKVPCHPCQLNRLCWQRQADPQDHGGQREQEGAKEMSGFSFHKDSRTTVGGRSLTLQGNSQVKKRRKVQIIMIWLQEYSWPQKYLWNDTHKAYVMSVTKHKRASSDFFSLIELQLAGTCLVSDRKCQLSIKHKVADNRRPCLNT